MYRTPNYIHHFHCFFEATQEKQRASNFDREYLSVFESPTTLTPHPGAQADMMTV